MLGIKKDDIVKILAGKDNGKTGKVLKILPGRDRAIVQGVNFVKKHVRKRRQEDQAGIVEQEASVNISNLSLICKRCDRTTRIGVEIMNDGSMVSQKSLLLMELAQRLLLTEIFQLP